MCKYTSVGDIVRIIQNGEAKRIIVACGAGISTSAGIPDFRDPEKGIYSSVKLSGYQNPQEVFTAAMFQSDPSVFYSIVRDHFMDVINARPTLTHYFIRLIANHKILLRCYTQNVDMLETKAGIDEDLIVFAHGNISEMVCISCKQKCSLTQNHIDTTISGAFPLCPCGEILKPNVVLFGEEMNAKYSKCVDPDTKQCDLLIVLGTSFTVPPFAHIIDMVPSYIPKLIINKTSIASIITDSYENVVNVLGECDAECLKLSESLGWKDELMNMMKN